MLNSLKSFAFECLFVFSFCNFREFWNVWRLDCLKISLRERLHFLFLLVYSHFWSNLKFLFEFHQDCFISNVLLLFYWRLIGFLQWLIVWFIHNFNFRSFSIQYRFVVLLHFCCVNWFFFYFEFKSFVIVMNIWWWNDSLLSEAFHFIKNVHACWYRINVYTYFISKFIQIIVDFMFKHFLLVNYVITFQFFIFISVI